MTSSLFVAIAVAVGTPAQITPDVRNGWKRLLDSDTVFGNYSDARVDAVALARARHLMYETAGAKPDEAAARALWVGVNLEYQGMLAASGPDARQDHAWRCQALGRKLRELLARPESSPRKLEGDSGPARWAGALLRLDAVEAEVRRDSPRAATPLATRVREVILADFSPATVTAPSDNPDPDTSPNARILSEVGGAFGRAKKLAMTVAAAAAQGSLALGRVYGYPADGQRDEIEKARRLADAEANGGGKATKGLYPPRDSDAWRDVVKLVSLTHGGGTQGGIVGAFADARDALKVPQADDLLGGFGTEAGNPGQAVPAFLAATGGTPAATPSRLWQPHSLYRPYRLAEIADDIGPSADRLAAIAPYRGGWLAGRTFGRLAIDPITGAVDDGGMGDYRAWFDRAVPGSTASARALAALDAESRRLSARVGPDGSPLDDATIRQLATVARGILGKTEVENETLVRKWLEAWVRDEAAKVGRWQPFLQARSPKKNDKEKGKNNEAPAPAKDRATEPKDGIPPAKSGVRRGRIPAGLARAEYTRLESIPAPDDGGTPSASDRAFIETCIGTIERGAPLPVEGRTRLGKIAESGADDKIKAVAGAALSEADRAESADATGRRIREEIRAQCGEKGRRIRTLLGYKGDAGKEVEAGSFAALLADIEKQEGDVAKHATEIARAFSLWGELKTRLEAASGAAASILADRDRLQADVSALRKELADIPRFALTAEEVGRLKSALLSTDAERPELPVPPAPDGAVERVLALRQKLDGYAVAVPVLAARLRERTAGANVLKEFGKNLLDNNKPAAGDTAYPDAIRVLTDPTPEKRK